MGFASASLILDCAIELENKKNQPSQLTRDIEPQEASPLEISVKKLAIAVQAMTESQITTSVNLISPAIKPDNNIKLADLIDNFITFKKDDVTTGTLASIKSKLLMFLGITNEFSQNKDLLS